MVDYGVQDRAKGSILPASEAPSAILGRWRASDPPNRYVYDGLTHSIRVQGTVKKKAFLAKIDITYEEHM